MGRKANLSRLPAIYNKIVILLPCGPGLPDKYAS